MRQVVQYRRTGQVSVLQVPEPILGPKAVRIRTLHSLISAGTEKTSVEFGDRNLLGKAKARPDLARKVYDLARSEGIQTAVETVRGRLAEVGILGYSLAGIAEAVGSDVKGIMAGDLVAAAGAKYANHAEIVVIPGNLVSAVPSGVPPTEAAFATVGAIALQGLRQAGPLIGEIFLVVGLGLIGQITVQLLKANGCQVLAYDLRADLVERARSFGAIGISADENTASQVLATTNGLGVDGAILTASTESSQPIELAASVCREKGRIVVVGAVGLNLPREPLYMKEVDVRFSKSYGPGRYDPRYEEGGQDYPYGYVRFTEKRNMEAFLQLLADRRVEVAPLVTHRFSISEASNAYDLIRGSRQEPYLAVMIDYPDEVPRAPTIALAERRESCGRLSVSFIGAGNYATAKLLPRLRHNKKVDLHGVLTTSGVKARNVGDRFGFRFCTGAIEEILDKKTDAVFIATRHESHARYVVEAMNAEKHVFVEKPLCLNQEELSAVAHAAARSTGHLLVGFNRRFAPLTRQVMDFVGTDGAPSIVHIRVNAGPVDSNHWSVDPNIGGGRILGEVCHFVDLAVAFTRSLPRRVFARAIGKKTASPLSCEDVAVTLAMCNGSLATILYSAGGGGSMRKERVELFSAGRSAVIDDFAKAELYGSSGVKHIGGRSQDKGQGNMLDEFLTSLRSTKPLVPLIELLAVSEATLQIIESLSSGLEVELTDWTDDSVIA